MTRQADIPPVAPALPPGTRVWVLSDGKAGDELQCVGVAEALGAPFELRRVAPRAPFVWAMPRGPIDPREASSRPGSPVAPPFPDLLIASGRRAVPYVRHVKRASGGATFTVILKDPRTGAKAADLIWAPEHDRIRGANVLTTLTSPHRVAAARLAAARAAPPPWLAGVRAPRVAVLVGGDSRHHRFRATDIEGFARRLAALAEAGAGLMGSRSRRTPEALAAATARVFAAHGGWWWDGAGENPYIALLAHADAFVATADSVNMIGEATATGKPILVFEPSGGHRKIARFLDGLAAQGMVHHFEGRLAGADYAPVDSTQIIAEAVARAYLARKRGGAPA